ncbi:transmembrane 7 superfamily member 3-like [Actinia tenebrosa]|uniref:Transmembrane 7 superfamily member 3-like n=1 Tax=Actinia tenebrosa TaxID=6105 RepID=A0A6P8H0B6_ACTTE|nr:transmembrane 7 superfamily member 3-like [Actinia tenebrosa]
MRSRSIGIIVIVFLEIVIAEQAFVDKSRVLIPGNGKLEIPANGGKTFTLQPNEQLNLQFLRTERNWFFVIFQVHSQYRRTLASTDALFTHDTTDTGSDPSVLYKLPYMHGEKPIPLYVKSNSSEDYQIDVISIPYSNGAPFPGGCCQTCNMELDPNLKVTYDPVKTTIAFYFANVFFGRNQKEIACDGYPHHPGKNPEHYRLEYNLYQMFLDEGNLEEGELFKGLQMMAYPDIIKTSGNKVLTVQAPTIPKALFDTLPGQGIIYNIIVYDPVTKKEAAYSPVHTYGCSFTSTIGNCYSIVSTINKVFAVVGAVIALGLCFMGHRLFKLALILGGVMNFGFIFYIILSESTSLSHTALMLTSLVIGIVGGLLMYALWSLTEYIRLCLLINGLFLGFLAAGTFLFTPVGDSEVWQSDFDYGMVVIAMTIVTPFIMLPWPKVLSIVYTSVVSAYGFIIGIDTFIHTSMSYLVLNIVIRAIEPNYDQVIVRRPFQYKDIILTVTWVFLSVVGISVQFYLARKRPDFPKSDYLEHKRIEKYYRTKKCDERTPILINEHGDAYRHNDIC